MKKRIITMLLAVQLLLCAIAPAALANPDAIRDSVVRLYVTAYATDSNGGSQLTAYIGTGFAVGKRGDPVKYFVTNKHVIEDAVNAYIIIGNSTDKRPCNVVAISDRTDLAVVSLDESITQRQAAILRPFDIEKLGNTTEAVWTYGYPGIMDSLTSGSDATGDALLSTSSTLSVTTGTLSQIASHATTQEGEQVFYDANISGGNSGGPLVDKDGYVLAVNTWRLRADVDNNSQVSFGPSVNEVIRLLQSENIPYTTADDVRSHRTLIIVLCVVGVLAIATVAVLLLRRGKKGSGKSNGRTLKCEAGDLAGRSFTLKGKTTIGRVPGHSDIALPESTSGVSKLHCTITLDSKGVVRVVDENSSYGTWIDQVKLQPGVPTVMHRGQKLYLGSKKQVFTLHS